MHRFALSALLAVTASVLPTHAQQPAFEVTTIKPNTTGESGSRSQLLPGGRVVITNSTVRSMIRNAYRLQNFQVIGGPRWLETEHWDVVAKADPTASSERALAMLQNMLADRFKLVTHNDARELPIYAIVLAKSTGALGPRLLRSDVDCVAYESDARVRNSMPPSLPGAPPACGTNTSPGRIHGGARTMADIARSLSIVVGRAVVDRTGLVGGFDVDLTWAPEPAAGSADAPTPDAGSSLFTAVQEQLALRLEAARAPVDVLVIDSAERPVED